MRTRNAIRAAAVPFPDRLIEQLPATEKRPAADFVAWYHYAQRLLATTDDYEWMVVELMYEGSLWVVHGRLIVEDGKPKDGIGHDATDPKAAESDAFKRAAAKWAYGLHLWAGADYWLEASLEKDTPG